MLPQLEHFFYFLLHTRCRSSTCTNCSDICIHVYMYICLYIFVYAYVYICTCMYVCMYVCTYTYIHIHIYPCTCTCTCIYKYMYIHVHICMCVYIYEALFKIFLAPAAAAQHTPTARPLARIPQRKCARTPLHHDFVNNFPPLKSMSFYAQKPYSASHVCVCVCVCVCIINTK
jgi:hypothetical protein